MRTLYKVLLGIFLFLLGVYVGFTIATYYYNQYQIIGVGLGLAIIAFLGNPFNIMDFVNKFRKDVMNKHDLKIVYVLDNPDISNPEPILEEKIVGHKFQKRNVRLDIQNNGDISAPSCEAHFKLKKPMDFDKYPSKEAKILQWVRDDSTSMDIKPHSTDNLLYLVILIDQEIDGNRAYVSRPHTMKGPILFKRDGLKIGEYEFELTVYPSIGKPVSQKFKMTIGNEWKDFSLEEIK